jgi:RNA polymerase sigma-70 factor (ECF subfamily)
VPAFEEVYEQHFDFVWRSLRRLGVHPSGLDDAVQDVFLVVHRRLLEFEGRSALKTWIFGIALHVAQRAARTRARHPAEELRETIADAHTPQDEAARREAITTLYALLDELDADKRAVFVMAELEQMTAPEIAEIARIPLNTVYSRLRAARREFEASLKRRQAHERWRTE